MRGFGRHVTKQPSDWPELFGMARTKESAQRYQTTFFAAILLAKVVGWERDDIVHYEHEAIRIPKSENNIGAQAGSHE